MEGSDAWTHGMRSPINAAQDGFDPRADSLFQSSVFELACGSCALTKVHLCAFEYLKKPLVVTAFPFSFALDSEDIQDWSERFLQC